MHKTFCMIAFWAGLLWSASLCGQGILRIPGSIKTSPIHFSDNLQLGPEGLLSVHQRKKDQALDPRDSSVRVTSDNGDEFVLHTSDKFKKITTPIPLEAKVATAGEGVSIFEIQPDSVAAWQRLKKWSELQTLNRATAKKVDGAAQKVKSSVVNVVLSENQWSEKSKSNLLKSYDEYLGTLNSAFDEAPSFDAKRQLARALDGVASEKLAWENLMEQQVIANPEEKPGNAKPSSDAGKNKLINPSSSGPAIIVRDLNTAPSPAAAASAFSPAAAAKNGPIQKAKRPDTSPESGSWVRYKDHDKLQYPRSSTSYLTVYENARACVGVAEVGGDTFASGVIIGNGLVLTCGHTVSQNDEDGNAPIDADKLCVRVGDFSPPDRLNTPFDEFSAHIYFVGKAIPLKKAANQGKTLTKRLLDFTLLEVPQLSAYIKEHHIQPIPLGYVDATADTGFYVIGSPYGGKQKITNHGEVCFPYEISKVIWGAKSRGQFSDSTNEKEARELKWFFEHRYVESKDERGDVVYHYNCPEGMPGVGVICETVEGNSGSPVIIKGVQIPYILGILTQGSAAAPSPYVVTIRNHEIMLPTKPIIDQLDGAKPDWNSAFDVSIYVKKKDPNTNIETLSLRPKSKK